MHTATTFASGVTFAPLSDGGEATSCDPRRTVVAVVVEWRGRVGMFRRSQTVAHDRGLWHCITGYLDDGTSAEQQALVEIFEETGLQVSCLTAFEPRGSIRLADNSGKPWVVHCFRATTNRRRLRINDEHDAYRWVLPTSIPRYVNRVSWLDDVLRLLDSGAPPNH